VAACHESESSLLRLYDVACRDQWTVAGLPWSRIELTALPLPIRQAAAEVFAQLHYGELTAMLSAARLLEQGPQGTFSLVCATQVNDEARHVRFFANLIGRLECTPAVRPSVRQLMGEVLAADSPELLMLGLTVMVEGVAHSLYQECARFFADFTVEGPLFDAVRLVVVDWLPRLLARDESRHIALGLHYLKARLPELDGAQRARLERKVEHWGELLHAMADGSDIVASVGVDEPRLVARCLADVNLRLAQVGLSARVRELP
jgi:hypothetical protein